MPNFLVQRKLGEIGKNERYSSKYETGTEASKW